MHQETMQPSARQSVKIDRTLQKTLLTQLAACYPKRDDTLLEGKDTDEEERIVTNLLYLEEHGLVEAGLTVFLSGDYGFTGAKITARGIDFLQNDGGLSAILGTVTVRFDDQTLKALISDRIEQSTLSEPEKKRWIDQLRSLPADATKHLTMKLVEAGLSKAPDAISAIGKFLGV